MNPILHQLLADIESSESQRLLVLLNQKVFSIDDLILMTDLAYELDDIREIFPSIVSEIILDIPISEFSKDIDFILNHLFQGSGKKSLKNKRTLLSIKKFLDTPDMVEYDMKLSVNLFNMIATIKNNEFKLRLRLLFVKLESMISYDIDSLSGSGE